MTPPIEERRSRVLSQTDIDAIVEAMHDGIDPEQHAEHHRLFKQWLQQQEDKRKRREQIKTQVGGWAVVATLGGIGTFVWHAVQAMIAEIAQRGGH